MALCANLVEVRGFSGSLFASRSFLEVLLPPEWPSFFE